MASVAETTTSVTEETTQSVSKTEVKPTEMSPECEAATQALKLTAKEYLTKAQELAKLEEVKPRTERKFDEAINNYSRALEAIVAEKGELHADCVPYYIQYGKLLLEGSKAESNMFAKIEQQQKAPAEEKKEAPATEEKQEVGMDVDEAKPSEAKPAESSTESSTAEAKPEDKPAEQPAKAEDSKEEEMKTESKEEAKQDEKSGKEEAATGASEEFVEPRQLAWELFESARVIMSKNESKDSNLLSELHTLLGETAMEDGNFERSYKEYVEAIKVLGKDVSVSDSRLSAAHQMAGMCSLYDQQMEAAVHHYLAAAEGFNNQIMDILIKHELVEKPKEESEMIEFVEDSTIEELKTKLGEEHKDYKAANQINGIVSNLIERINEIQNQEESDANNPDIQNIVRGIAIKMAQKLGQPQGEGAEKATSQSGFDMPTIAESKEEGAEFTENVNVLVPKKRTAPECDENRPAKKTKLSEETATETAS